jgi:NDP-sugar pyrophosphorylase family protein
VKAVVLVGGLGTRLRPLTETVKKELLPLVDRPSLDHVLDHLALHGVHQVVLSSSYLEGTFDDFLRARRGDPAIRWITEEEPLNTGGAIINALPYLGDEPFLALNGDILTDLDLVRMVASHRERGAEVTIALHRAQDARAFGLVLTASDSRVLEFREKPTEAVAGDINAGTYLIDPGALGGWRRGEAVSIEREIFPALIARGRPVFGFLSSSYWLDLGTPEKYLQAHADLLDGRVGGEPAFDAPWVAPGAVVDRSARLGRHVAIGPGAEVGPTATLEDSVLHPGARVGAGAVVRRSILGARSIVGDAARLDGCVLGEAATVAPGAAMIDARISGLDRVE